MIAAASGVAEGAALVVPPPPPAALAAGEGEAAVPQAATSRSVIPTAARGERGRGIRPPPLVPVGSAVGSGRGGVSRPESVGWFRPPASSGPADGALPHPLGRAGRARVGRASRAGPRRWTLNSKVSPTYD